MLQPFDYDPNEKNKHKFMVQTMIAPDGKIENQEALVSVTVRRPMVFVSGCRVVYRPEHRFCNLNIVRKFVRYLHCANNLLSHILTLQRGEI